MNRKTWHNKNCSDPKDLSNKIFSGAEISWAKNKDEIWRDFSVRLKEEVPRQKEVRLFLSGRRRLALVASLALLLAVTGFMRFYMLEFNCKIGKHTSLKLPDGSRVELNAQTSIKYHPYWWFISRKVHLNGEAYFDVKKGKQFQVMSSMAATEVVGTSFNIYARDLKYRVTCHSGLVKVTSIFTEEFITLMPNEHVDLDNSGVFNITHMSSDLSTPDWMNNMIMFASTPLRLVFDEIERQYGIVIESPTEMVQLYSGKFSLDKPVENVLYILCRPFDLKYEKYTGKKYIVFPAQAE